MNLRELCQMPQFPIALLTTYNIDPLFFERVVLTDLIQGGATNIIVLADADQALTAVQAVQGQLLALGKRYRLIPIRTKASFHPKVCIRIGRTGAVVACGSHNLTRAGWLGGRKDNSTGGNREVTLAWQINPLTHAAAELRQIIDTVTQLPSSQADRDELRRILTPIWLSTSSNAQAEAWSWVMTGVERPLAAILEERWRGRRFEQVRLVCGSTDKHGAMIRWAAEVFGVSKAIVEVDTSCCSFDPVQLAKLPVDLRIVPYDGNPRTHLKAAIFESPSGSAAVVGSANCSGAAWLRKSSEAGNIESVVIFDSCNPTEFSHLFRSGLGDARRWEELNLTVRDESSEEEKQAVDHRLVQLQLHRAAGELIAVLDCEIASATRLFAVIQSSRVPLASTSIPGVFRGPMPDIQDSPETLFGHIEFVSGEHTLPPTNEMWVNDVDRLSEVAGRHHRFDSVRRLASMGGSADYRRLLEDMHILSHTLLCQPDEFPDGMARRHRDKRDEQNEPPKSLTDADVIRALDRLSSMSPTTATSSAFSGSISLTGIMQTFFAEGIDAADIDPTASEHQRSQEEKETEQAEANLLDQSSDKEAAVPTETQRSRLADQLQRFVDQLSEPAFTTKCSARQLQQAAAFPLAIAKFASRGPWVQNAELQQFAQTMQRTCELLFFRRHTEFDPTTKTTRNRTPIFEEVRERYLAEDRVEDFDQIVGDGILWLALMGSLTLLSGASGQRFARNLIIRDIARYPGLSSSVVPEQLASLARRIRFETDVDPVVRAKRLVEDFAALEALLRSRFDELKAIPTKGSAGDWLWNTGVGFAQIVELEDHQKATVHIRIKADTRKNVLLSYYLNLRILAEQNDEIRRLFEACAAE